MGSLFHYKQRYLASIFQLCHKAVGVIKLTMTAVMFFSLLPNLKIFTATKHWHMHVFTFNRISLTGMILFHFLFRCVFFLLVDFQLVFDIQWASLFNFLVPSTDCSLLKFLFLLSTSHTTHTHTGKYRYFSQWNENMVNFVLIWML